MEAYEAIIMNSRSVVLAGVVLSSLLLNGCAGPDGSKSACEVFSPATVTMPSTQNDQRVATNSTGVPAEQGARQQNCDSK
jgi:hypothetical protein